MEVRSAPARWYNRALASGAALSVMGRSLAIALAFVVALAARPARADISATMSAGPAFFDTGDVNEVARELNFDSSLSPGIEGGVQLRFGHADRGLCVQTGLGVFWSRRRHTESVSTEQGRLVAHQSTFRVTALDMPATLMYSATRWNGRVYSGAGVAYYVATVSVEAEVVSSGHFSTSGSTTAGERSADGLGFHALFGYERPTSIGAIGGGVLVRSARFSTDPERGTTDFDVDLSGITLFISLSVSPMK